MKCEDRIDAIYMYAQNELTGGEHEELARHFASCPVCRERLAKIQALEACERSGLKTNVPTPDIVGSVMANLPRAAAGSRRIAWVFGLAGATAAIFAAGVVVGARLGASPPKEPVIIVQKPKVVAPMKVESPATMGVVAPLPVATKTSPRKDPAVLARRDRPKLSPRVRRTPERNESRPAPLAPPVTTAKSVNVACAGCLATGIEPNGLNDARPLDAPNVEGTASQ